MSIHYGKNIKTRYFKGYINNFTTVGTLTFDGSVVSEFSSSNYLRLPFEKAFKPENNPWEIVLKINLTKEVTTQGIFGYRGSGYFRIDIYKNKLRLNLSTSSSSWTIGQLVGNTVIPLNVDCWIKYEFTGEAYNLYYSFDGVVYHLDGTLSSTSIPKFPSSTSIGAVHTGSDTSYLNGSLDLSECYININGQRWWDGLKRCKYDYNFNVTGTPTITNPPSCEVSGFSTSNYLSLPEVVPLATADSWEKVVKVTHKASSGIQAFLTTSNDSGGSEDNFGINNNKAFFRCSISSSSELFNITGSTLLVDGNTYWLKIEFTGDTYNLYLSTTGEFIGEETLEGAISSTTKCLSRKHYIGNTLINNYNYPPIGSIDLTQSYIKINGELWWSCFKQSDDYVFTKEATKEDYDYTIFKDGKIGHFYRGDLHRIDYYKYIYENWEQPVLTSNTSHGTVSSTNYNSSHPPYVAFDGVKANGTNKYLSNTIGTGDITWQTPEPIKINSCELYTTTEGGYLNRFPQTITVYGSDNGVDWIEIGNLSGYAQPASGGFVTVPCNASKAYAYSKWEFTGSTYVGISEIVISAQKQVGVVESTIDDYDYIETYQGEIILAYKGETLVYSLYPNGVVFEENTAGTYTISPAISGPYEISLVGPGSGGTAAGDQPSYASKSRGAGGGSGAYVKGIWNLTRGVDYTIVVGAGGPAGPTTSNNGYSQAAGDSSFGDIIVCGGGGGATAVWKGSGIGGAGGTVKACENPIQLITRTAGNQGSAGGGYTYYAGGESKLPPHGAGGFGQATGNYAGKSAPGENGYCKVRMLTIEPQPQKINVNFVGNVNFDNGLVNNFTTANYLMLPETLPSADEFEFGGKIILAAKSTATKCIYEISTSSWTGFNIALDSSSRLRLWTGSQTSTGSTLEANKDYWFKCVCNSTGSTLYLSTDGVEYTQDITIKNNQYSSWVNPTVCLGVRGYNKAEPLTNDTIDLNECYIKINNGLWWKGIITVKPYTVTINTRLSGAVVTINGEQRNTITAMGGEFITWSLTYQGSIIEEGRVLLTEDTEININIDRIEFVPWEQPVATASTTAIEGGDMVITASNEYSTYNAYKALDGVKSGTTATTGWGTNNSTAVQWWQLKLPYKIKITGLADYQRYDTTPANANTIGRFYTSSDKTTPIGDEYNNTIATNWNKVEVTGIPKEGIVTDTIYFEKTGGGAYGGLGELEITADKIVKIVDGE